MSNEVDQFKELLLIFNEVFENSGTLPSEAYLAALLDRVDFKVLVALVGEKVVGGLTVHVLPNYYEEKPMAYIYDVGIDPPFQRKGIGNSLISEVCRYCKENGFAEAYVEAEADDLEAIRFYRKTKYTDEVGAIHFTYEF